MTLESCVRAAFERGASDLHLEPGQPAIIRVQGGLVRVGEPQSGAVIAQMAQNVVGSSEWPAFLARRSYDASRVVAGVRCRINVMKSARGVGLAVRLLAGFKPSLERLNLHPDLARFAKQASGLVLITGATGSGKSSTMAALIHEINTRQSRHILTVEAPIEYTMTSARSLIRQREVGRDTPSFEQALVDALREDPDVIVVGEMRTPEVMRLTLGAAETGHLVFATLHSATCVEALGRLVASFPPESQAAVSAQLADCLVGVVAQQLTYDRARDLRLPVCEVLMANHAVKGLLRKQEMFRIASVIETGRDDGMWTFERYRRWLATRSEFVRVVRPQLKAEAANEAGASLPPLPSPSHAAAALASAAVGGSAGLNPAPPPSSPPRPPAPSGDLSEVDDLISQLSKGPKRP